MIRQTAAIFLDAYRELNSKRLFWVVLVLSGLVVAVFAAVGINAKGITILHWQIPSAMNTSLVPASLFYKYAFAVIAIPWWLGWIATILALVSTASIIPDLVSNGSIELLLCKPIGRVRLLLTKYAAGLLFVALQVTVFTMACMLVIGFRGHSWELGLLWAVPLSVTMFSYVFCVCGLLGVVTRSTIASLLLTVLLWFAAFGVHTTEDSLLIFHERAGLRVETMEQRVARLEKDQKPAEEASSQPGAAGESDAPDQTTDAPKESPALAAARQSLDEERHDRDSLRKWHRIAFIATSILPKTAETTQLLARKLLSASDMEKFTPEDGRGNDPMPDRRIRISPAELRRRYEAAHRDRTTGWTIGTSLAFEAAVLGLAALIFARRDF